MPAAAIRPAAWMKLFSYKSGEAIAAGLEAFSSISGRKDMVAGKAWEVCHLKRRSLGRDT